MILAIFIITLVFKVAFAQIGGTQAETDTMRLADKFAVYKIAAGQTLVSKNVSVDTLLLSTVLDVPTDNSLPTCDANKKGELFVNNTTNSLNFCDGVSWNIVAYDSDFDGLTTTLDSDDNVAFSFGTATDATVMTGKTFYTGSGMTYTTGNITTITQNISPSTSDTYIQAGYHDGNGVIYAVSGQYNIGGIATTVYFNTPYANVYCGTEGVGWNTWTGSPFASTLGLNDAVKTWRDINGYSPFQYSRYWCQ